VVLYLRTHQIFPSEWRRFVKLPFWYRVRLKLHSPFRARVARGVYLPSHPFGKLAHQEEPTTSLAIASWMGWNFACARQFFKVFTGHPEEASGFLGFNERFQRNRLQNNIGGIEIHASLSADLNLSRSPWTALRNPVKPRHLSLVLLSFLGRSIVSMALAKALTKG
jgi:hypothetical protein